MGRRRPLCDLHEAGHPANVRCRDDRAICAELAQRLGINDYDEKTEEQWLRDLTKDALDDFEAFKEAGVARFAPPKDAVAFAEQEDGYYGVLSQRQSETFVDRVATLSVLANSVRLASFDWPFRGPEDHACFSDNSYVNEKLKIAFSYQDKLGEWDEDLTLFSAILIAERAINPGLLVSDLSAARKSNRTRLLEALGGSGTFLEELGQLGDVRTVEVVRRHLNVLFPDAH